ncbi:MAG: hypothetical protein U0166_01905 [Acidobacteriota bacterium]
MNALSRPPRDLPVSTRLVLLFGTGVTQIGFGVVAFTSLFFWIFFPVNDLVFVVAGLAGTSRVSARIEGDAREVGSENGVDVYRMSYRYTDALDRQHEGRAYATGASLPDGDEVTVDYSRVLPYLSKAQGLRSSPFGPGGAIVLVFPFIGLGLVAFGASRGRKASRLLAQGELALAKLVDRRPTNLRINGRTVYELTFGFPDARGTRQQGSVSTHLCERLEDDAEEVLLYDPEDPSRIFLADDLPSGARLDDRGNPVPVSLARAAFAAILPALVIAAQVAIAMRKLLP